MWESIFIGSAALLGLWLAPEPEPIRVRPRLRPVSGLALVRALRGRR